MAPLYRIGDALFDPELSRLERGGTAVELQPKLRGVLLYLIENPDRVVTHTELLRAVWPDVVVGASSLTRAVSLLRTALGESASGSNVIATQSRRGYRLVAQVEEIPFRVEKQRNDPFVGRDEPLAELERAWNAARAGRGAVAVISGEAGIGKTRLADELVTRVRASGSRSLVGFCPPPGGVPPLWPWVRALRGVEEQEGPGALEAVAKRARVDLNDLLPEHVALEATARPADGAPAQFALLDALERLLAALAAERPLLLVLDDLHWADRSSLRALEHVARGVERQRLLVVATFREEEVDAQHPLHALLAVLARGPEDLRIRLGPLDEPTSDLLVSTLSAQAVPAEMARAIRTRSAGNPLFLRELVRAWTQDGVAPAAGSLPPGIRELLDARTRRLPPPLRAVLQAAAVLGGELEVGLLRELVDVDAPALAGLLDAAADGGWLRLVARAPTRYAFTHPLVHDAMRTSLSPAERVALHARAAAVLARDFGDRPELVQERLAEHHLEMARGRHPDARAAQHAARAAALAERRLAFDEAARWFERAIEALDLEPVPDAALRGDALVGVARMRWAVGDRTGARVPAEAAAALARRTGDGELLARAGLVFWVRGAPQPDRYLNALEMLNEAGRMLGESHLPLRAEILARSAEYMTSEPDALALTSDACEQALELARSADLPETLYSVLYCTLFSCWRSLPAARRCALSDELMQIADGLGDATAQIEASTLHLTSLLQRGDVDAAEKEIERFGRAIERFEVPSFFRWYGPLYRAMRATLAGRLEDGERLARESFGHAQRAHVYDAPRAFATQLFAIRFDQGRLLELAAPVADMAKRYPTDFSYVPLHALILAETGGARDARATFESFFDHFDPRMDHNHDITDTILANVCESLGDKQRARVIYDRLVGAADLLGVNLSGWICQGSLHWPLGKLAALFGDAALAERHFVKAERRNAKVGARSFLVRTRYDHARLCTETGDTARARKLVAAALESAREIGMLELAARSESLARKLAR